MITIFTDGAARGNPGPGGWGAIIVGDDEVRELGGREDHTTNNRMEMLAAISALENVLREHDIVVNTDSAYLISGITRWVKGWQKNDWKTSQKEDVINRDLWERLVEATEHRVISWNQVKGHAGIPANERCDIIATSFADKKPIVLYRGSPERYGVDLSVAKSSAGSSRTSPTSLKLRGARAYSYVSMVGGVVQTHRTWDECKARVNGVSGARFKKSVSPEDEEKIMREFQVNS
jgi:ribonuclease HI